MYTSTTTMIPVYKFYSTDPWRFFYSTNLDDNAIRDGWTRAEQIAFYAYKTQVPGTIPVYRFVATAPFRYQYSTQARPAGLGWKNEGPAFYAFPSKSANTVAVIQYYAIAPDGGWRYQYMTEPTNPGNLQGWTRDRVAFYVPIFAAC